MKKPPAPSPARERNMYADIQRRLAETRAHLDRVDEMLRRHRVRFVYVKPAQVRAHTRGAHWRPYYPPTLKPNRT